MTDVSFSVDPDGLDRLRAQLGAIESGMQDSGTMAGAYDPLDLGPNEDVWNALQAFHNDWSNGLSMIKHNIGQLLGLLARAAEDYRGTDDQIAQTATPQPGQVG
jgi:hypothetical protein